jgi:hypothetical protein
MSRRALAAAALCCCAMAGSDRSPAWADPPVLPRVAEPAELGRLGGHRVELVAGGYRIVDVAGEGAPVVGVVERRGAELWLVGGGAARRLAGPLAQPRIAGPGYKVWVLGVNGPDGSLVARRLGVLARPAAAP